MLCFNENVIRAAWQHRYSQLSQAVNEQLQEFKKRRGMTNELLLIKRNNNIPQKGDILLVEPREGIYFYGCVLDTGVDFDWKGAIVIALFTTKLGEITLGDFFPSEDNLLAPPQIIMPFAWKQGYCYTIGNVDPSGINIDYGFVDIVKVSAPILDARGQTIDHIPRHLRELGCGGVGAVAASLTRELIINPWLLDFDIKSPTPYPPLQEQTAYIHSFPVTEC